MERARREQIVEEIVEELYDNYGVVPDEDSRGKYRMDMAPLCNDIERAIERAYKEGARSSSVLKHKVSARRKHKSQSPPTRREPSPSPQAGSRGLEIED